MSTRTQISSRYSPDNKGLFHFKKLVVDAGFDVAFPVGDSIIAYEQGFAITHPQEAITPFHVSEIRFLNEVKNNPVQIVYNINNSIEGYIGESTSIETAYAILFNKPIFMLRNPFCANTVPENIKNIIEKNISMFHILDLDNYSPSQIRNSINSLSLKRRQYDFDYNDEENLMIEVYTLCYKYAQSWKLFNEQNNYQPQTI